MAIKWFSEVDMNDKGKVSGDLPARYFDRQIEELAEEIRGMERDIEMEMYRGKDLMNLKRKLKERKARHEAIMKSKPILEGADKDKVAKTLKELGKKIGASMFNYTAMQKISCDPHEEAKRMVSPCIEVNSDVEADYCKQRGIKIVDGKISRDQASFMYKTFAKDLGEDTDIESLRNPR
jgi:hypothetical protein